MTLVDAKLIVFDELIGGHCVWQKSEEEDEQ
jgi:hypothetical protein